MEKGGLMRTEGIKKPVVFFTSDTHFGHENVIKYSNRPFNNKDEMDRAMIENWNSRVGPNDLVYHLGDVFFHKEDRALSIIKQLNGQKFLVYGNHDKTIKRSEALKSQFVQTCDYHEISIEGQDIVLCHYPMLTWNKSSHGSWHLHGHCHHNLKYPFKMKILDVGVDGPEYNYSPLSFNDVSKRLKSIEPEFPDHHGV